MCMPKESSLEQTMVSLINDFRSIKAERVRNILLAFMVSSYHAPVNVTKYTVTYLKLQHPQTSSEICLPVQCRHLVPISAGLVQRARRTPARPDSAAPQTKWRAAAIEQGFTHVHVVHVTVCNLHFYIYLRKNK